MEHGVILVGGGGHALVVAGSLRRAGAAVVGFLDDDPAAVLAHEPAAVERLGALSQIERIAAAGADMILALGDLTLRRRLIDAHPHSLRRGLVVIDGAAMVAVVSQLGAGVYVGAKAVVQVRASVGEHAIINTGAIIEHECRIGANVHVAPGAVLGGRVSIGPDTLIGLGSRVLPGVRIGSRCVVGAGAVVTRDVPDGACVVGVPARVI
ncbi:MAG: NeuD/PglB/VioB family sugar acetyltransferase [Phycisphaerales bacterium]|nr:NeuD/PglB/VioB family sugar acetyltransferase [Phycisphaerales bacterium]